VGLVAASSRQTLISLYGRPNERLKEAKATGATALVTSCPWCERNFKDAVKEYGEAIEVYDIAELALKAIQ